MPPLLVVVSGPPATGKTALAERISKKFELPLLTKDSIKESLFDSLGWNDRECSKQLGVASVLLLFKLVETMLEVRLSAVVESAFISEFDNPRFKDLRSRFVFHVLQIHCTADPDVVLARFRGREAPGCRHPGHAGGEQWIVAEESLKARLSAGTYGALKIDGQLITVDTTDFSLVDYGALLVSVEHAMGGRKVANRP